MPSDHVVLQFRSLNRLICKLLFWLFWWRCMLILDITRIDGVALIDFDFSLLALLIQ